MSASQLKSILGEPVGYYADGKKYGGFTQGHKAVAEFASKGYRIRTLFAVEDIARMSDAQLLNLSSCLDEIVRERRKLNQGSSDGKKHNVRDQAPPDNGSTERPAG